MIFHLVILLILFPKLIHSDGSPKNILASKKQPILSDIFFKIIRYGGYALTGLFAVDFFLQYWLSWPQRKRGPNIVAFVFQIIFTLIIIAACIIFFMALTKTIIEDDKNDSNEDENDDDIYNYNYMNNKDTDYISNLYSNLTKSTENYLTISYSLKNMIINYNETFSNPNKKYRIAFNKIYSNPKTNVNLKNNLQEMDKSRIPIISKIKSFTETFINFTKSIQKSLQSIHQYYFTQNDDKSIDILNSKLDAILNDYIEEQKDGYSAFNIINILIAICTMFFSIFTGVFFTFLFLCNGCCPQICMCSFPIFGFIILVGGTLSQLFLYESSYRKILGYCNYEDNEYNPNNPNNPNDPYNPYKFLQIGVNHGISPKSNDEIFELFDSMTSEKVHLNFESIYAKYSKNTQFSKELDQMKEIINKNDRSLLKMKTIMNEMQQYSFSAYSNLTKIYDKMEMKTRRNALTDEETCNTIVEGYNLCVIATIIMYVTLLIMVFNLCIRRRSMDGNGCSCYFCCDNNCCYTSRSYFNDDRSENELQDINENNQTQSRSRQQPARYERLTIVNFGIKTLYCCVYITESREFDLSSFLQDGRWGMGIYLSDSKEAAFTEYLSKQRNTSINAARIVFYTFRVNLGRTLIVPRSCASSFSFPDTLNENNCQSVKGYVTDDFAEYVIFDMENLQQTNVELLTSDFIARLTHR